MLINGILMVISHPAVAYMLSTVLYYLLEQELCKYSILRPVGADPVPVGGRQALVGFLGLEVFLV